MSLFMGSKCNLRCSMCFRDHDRSGKGPEMPLDYALEVLQLVRKHNSTLHLAALGEPIMHDAYFEILNAYLAEGSSIAFLNSNGMRFDKKIAAYFLETAFPREIEIFFSVDGFKEEIESQRIGTRYEVIENNILHFLQARRDARAEDRIKVGINCVLNEESMKYRDDFVRLWLGRGIDQVFLKSPLTRQGGPLQYERSLVLNPDLLPDMSENIPCRFLNEYFFLNAELDRAHICCWDFEGLLRADLRDPESIQQFWRSKAYRDVVEAQFHDRLEYCRGCEYKFVQYSPWTLENDLVDGIPVTVYKGFNEIKYRRLEAAESKAETFSPGPCCDNAITPQEKEFGELRDQLIAMRREGKAEEVIRMIREFQADPSKDEGSKRFCDRLLLQTLYAAGKLEEMNREIERIGITDETDVAGSLLPKLGTIDGENVLVIGSAPNYIVNTVTEHLLKSADKVSVLVFNTETLSEDMAARVHAVLRSEQEAAGPYSSLIVCTASAPTRELYGNILDMVTRIPHKGLYGYQNNNVLVRAWNDRCFPMAEPVPEKCESECDA
jgi:Radical SAM superfamily.